MSTVRVSLWKCRAEGLEWAWRRGTRGGARVAQQRAAASAARAPRLPARAWPYAPYLSWPRLSPPAAPSTIASATACAPTLDFLSVHVNLAPAIPLLGTCSSAARRASPPPPHVASTAVNDTALYHIWKTEKNASGATLLTAPFITRV